MSTKAVKKGDTYIVNGTKHWITGGGVSKLHLIFARVIEDGEDQGIAGFIAIRDETPGLKIGSREPAMGIRGIPEREIIFEDMEIDQSMMVVPPGGLFVLKGETQFGQSLNPKVGALMQPGGVKRGFAGLMNAYNAQRVGAATVAMGIAQGAYDLALEYAQTREQFGRPIAEFQGLQWMLADMATQITAAQAVVYKAAASAEWDGYDFPDLLLAAQGKILSSDMAIKVTSDALQVYGAMGYSRNLPLERMYRDARMFTIAGGTAQVLRTLVASQILGRKLPQTRDGYSKLQEAGRL